MSLTPGGLEHTLYTLDKHADKPRPESTTWREQAECAGMAPSIFDDDSPLAANAVAICARCPVSAECLADARRCGDTWGIRGGLAAGGRVLVPIERLRSPRYEYDRVRWLAKKADAMAGRKQQA